MEKYNISRREFLKRLGLGSAVVAGAGASLTGCAGGGNSATADAAKGEMTYRTNPSTGDRVSILGYGCMRWPQVQNFDGQPWENDYDQEQINRLVDRAIECGVNYFDTSPVYCKGFSETLTGNALSRHPRDSYYIATKLSNFDPNTWSFEAGKEMFEKSLEYLQTDYVDYLLLHAIGQGARDLDGNSLNGMQAFEARYIDNGLLDWLLEQREKGRIRNLGFSYHGDIDVYDRLLAEHDKYRWDFVQIQLNYIDWEHAKQISEDNTNADYLYDELRKRNIPAVIMEPLLGGRLANMPRYASSQMRSRRPDDSTAAWAFRFAGTPEGVLTVLSGMTYMEHLEDNLRTYCPLEPCTDEEMQMLSGIANAYVSKDYIPCTGCKYCMPCPYGLDIPAIFTHYNKCITEARMPESSADPDYRSARRAYLVGYDRAVPRLRQADHCIGCGKCMSHCPQQIAIPEMMAKIDGYVERLKQNTL